MIAKLYEDGMCVERSHDDAVRWAGTPTRLERFMNEFGAGDPDEDEGSDEPER